MNEQKWVGVLTFRELEKGKWYIPIICANVKSKLRKVKGNENVYKGIGRKLLTYLEHDVKEIKDNDQICLYHDPDNMGMKELAKKLGYHSQPGNKGSKEKTKGEKAEKVCKKRKRGHSTSGSDTTTTDEDVQSSDGNGKPKGKIRKVEPDVPDVPGTGVMTLIR